MFSGRQLTDYIYLIPAILLSLTFHELSHAYVSYKLGDPTAKQMGRLTLNPVKHLDPLGTLMLLFSNFGWAKPVPINPMYYRDRRKGTMLVSVAGPMSNLILAIIFYTIRQIIVGKYSQVDMGQWDIRYMLYVFSSIMISINIGLAAFNLLPFPPLDGSKIFGGFLPPKYYYKMLSVENYISFAFLFLVFALPGVLSTIMSPITTGLAAIAKAIAVPIANLFI